MVIRILCCCVVECAGCNEMINTNQILLALDKPWHVHCFKCHHCDCLLSGEYMGK